MAIEEKQPLLPPLCNSYYTFQLEYAYLLLLDLGLCTYYELTFIDRLFGVGCFVKFSQLSPFRPNLV